MLHAEKILRAFESCPLTDAQRRAVEALLNRPNSTSTELSRVCGWGGRYWNLVFGTMCKQREPLLAPAPCSKIRHGPFYSAILADFNSETWRFTMKPDAAVAFSTLGFRPGLSG